jgi:hypothetical protein
MIDFEFELQVLNQLKMYHAVAEGMMRPISRDYNEREHENPWDFFNAMWSASTNVQASPQGDSPSAKEGSSPAGEKDGGPKLRNLYTCLSTEELCWGDAGLFLSIPSSGLGGAAVGAAGTPEQKERFLRRFREGKPKWGDGDYGAGVRFGLRRDHHDRDSRRRPLGNQRDQNLLHRWPDGGGKIRRLRGRVGDGRQEGGPRGD